MRKISNDGFADCFQERQDHFLSAFLRADADSRVLPVNVIQKQFGGRDTPYPIHHHQNDDRTVSSARWAVFIDRVEHTFQRGILNGASRNEPTCMLALWMVTSERSHSSLRCRR